MNKYFYKAKSGPHDIVEGYIDAHDEKEAHQKLTRQNLFPISVADVRSAKAVTSVQTAQKVKIKGRVRSQDLALFTFHLSNLISAGLTLARALELLSEQLESKQLAEICVYIHEDIKQGVHFSDALEKYPHVFSSLLVNTVRAGEAGGKLEEVLTNLSTTYDREEETRSRVKGALTYPTIVLIMAVLMVSVLMIFVVPKLTEMYDDLGQTLPLLTRVIVGTSDFIVDFWWIFLGVFLIAAFFFRNLFKKDNGKKAIFNLLMKVPMFGDIALRANMATFSRVLGMLLSSGVNILEALRVTESVMDVPALSDEIQRARQEVTRGIALSAALNVRKIFPKFIIQMIAIGEESGDLDATLLRVAGTYDRDVSRRVQFMTTILEPLMIVVVGLIVAVIIIGMLLPIFQINIT